MQKRRLGRTNLEASIIGFGGWPIAHLKKEEGIKVVRSAFELGINYFDTARGYWDSEEKIGPALEDVRDGCILASKTHLYTKKGAEAYLRQSLHNLRTDRIDIIQLHGVIGETLEKAMGPEGAMEALKEARSRGEIDFIGVTSHYPSTLIKAITTGEFDVILVPLNVATRHAADDLIPLARKLDVGVAIMKPFGGDNFIQQCPEFGSLLGTNKSEMARRALRFILAHDVTTVVPGLGSIEEVEAAANVGEEPEGLTMKSENIFQTNFEEPYCRNCGTLDVCNLCQPCPEILNIPAVLRFYECYRRYGMREWAREQYRRLITKVDGCSKCGECEQRCPYNLPIMNMLQEAEKILRPPMNGSMQ